MQFFFHFGKYLLFLRSILQWPQQVRIYAKQTFHEMNAIGIGSLGIVIIISVFVGAVTTVQTAYQLVTGLVSKSIIATILRDSMILELAPTITCLVLAGKIGANIASELGNMRISEQIDALEIMGVNSSSYLVLPKLIAGFVTIPMLIILAMFLGIYGGYIAGTSTEIITPQEFISGMLGGFRDYTLFFAIVKSYSFSFIIVSVSAFHGYFVEGGALEVGRASTKAVVYSCVAILFSDYILAELFL